MKTRIWSDKWWPVKSIAAVIFVALAVTACTSTVAEKSANGTQESSKRARAQIYMFRGGFNGVFSTGITQMAAELRSRGIPAKDVSWAASANALQQIQNAVAENSKTGPIILAGHSLGASSVIGMARTLTNKNIPVDLLIVFDPLGSSEVPRGVRKMINFKASGSKNNDGGFRAADGNTGDVVNVDIRNLPELENANHWNIVNQEALQRRVVREIEMAYRRHR